MCDLLTKARAHQQDGWQSMPFARHDLVCCGSALAAVIGSNLLSIPKMAGGTGGHWCDLWYDLYHTVLCLQAWGERSELSEIYSIFCNKVRLINNICVMSMTNQLKLESCVAQAAQHNEELCLVPPTMHLASA
jgi:hypothetical protein